MIAPATEFTPLASTLGGVMIGAAAVLLMAFNGRIAGVSGFAQKVLPPSTASAVGEGLAFLGGLILAPLVYAMIFGQSPAPTFIAAGGALIAAGLLVGFGAAWGGGCTSGHGVCGLARVSKRSFAATAVFMAAGFVTVFLVRHIWG